MKRSVGQFRCSDNPVIPADDLAIYFGDKTTMYEEQKDFRLYRQCINNKRRVKFVATGYAALPGLVTKCRLLRGGKKTQHYGNTY